MSTLGDYGNRSMLKRRLREAMLDQIANDKLMGLEDGKICRAYYKKLKKRDRPPVRKSKDKPREAATYRGARRNDSRGSRRSLALKAQRLASGETRSQADHRRQQEAAR